MFWWTALILFAVAAMWLFTTVAKEKKRIERREEGGKYNFAAMLNTIPRVDVIVNKDAPKLRRQQGLASEFKIRGITRATPFNKVCDFVVIDLETTGIKTGGNRIIEFSAIRFAEFEPVDCITQLIDPEMEIPPDATAINNITNGMVSGMPKFYEIADFVKEYIGKSAIVGHNVIFDLKHLYASGLDLSEHKLMYCTLELSRKKNKGLDSHKLDSACEHLGIYREESHRALSDCLATAAIYAAMLTEIMPDQETIKDFLNKLKEN
jgi:DNA polymerase-3 subunit epsilon